MNLTAQEKLMYQVMAALFESDLPISFKGSMVLKAFLIEMGYTKEIRHTADIDANWKSDYMPSAEQIVEALQKVLEEYNISLDVTMYRMYGEGRSAGFDLIDKVTGEKQFSMDMDVNRPATSTKMYEVEGLHFRGNSPLQIIADKLSAISTDKVFRRVKDVIDLYYLSEVFDFDKTSVMETLEHSGRTLDSFHGFLDRVEDLRHAYDRFRFAGGVYKPPFDEVYNSVKSYIEEALAKEKELECEL